MKTKRIKQPRYLKTDFSACEIWTVEYNKTCDMLHVGTLHGLAEHAIDSPVYKAWKLIGIFKTAKAAHDYCDEIRSKSAQPNAEVRDAAPKL